MAVSATKVPLTSGELDQVLGDLGADGAVVTGSLDGGLFNIAYRVELPDGTLAVLKVAPPPQAPVLTHEHGLVLAELDFLDHARDRVPVPRVLGRSVSRERPAFLMSWVTGTPLNEADVPADHVPAIRRELGRLTARIGTVTRTVTHTSAAFGYCRPDGSLTADSWSVAVEQMWEALRRDAIIWEAELPDGVAAVPDLLRRARPVLDAVRVPVLTHFDLWDGNILVDVTGDATSITGLIDGERRFWGDPLAELVSTSLLSDAATDTAFLAGYDDERGSELVFDSCVRARLALYGAYLSTIMLVEQYPRGTRSTTLDHHVGRALSEQLRQADEALRDLGL